MSMFRVNTSTLKSQAEQLSNLNETFKTQVNNLSDKENALSNMWEGEARNAFHNAYATDAEKFQNFYNGIARFVQALSDAAQEYAKAEQTASSIGTKRG
jgi:WXG100 family type VII secretion target